MGVSSYSIPALHLPNRLWTAFVLLACLLGYQNSYAAPPMSGTYTVCASGCNYNTIQKAANDLMANGMNGKTILYIRSGNYNEQVTIGAISGLNSSNTLIIKGDGRYGTKRTRIYFNDYRTFILKAVSDVTLTNICIEATGSAYYRWPGGGALNISASSNVKVKYCHIIAGGGGSYDFGLYAGSCSFGLYENNRIEGGFYNNSYDTYVGKLGKEDTVRFNTITAYMQYGYYNYYGSSNQVYNNIFDSANSTSSIGIYSYYESGASYFNNALSSNNVNLYIYYPNGASTLHPFQIYNNILSTLTIYNMLIYDYSSSGNINVHILHNTLYQDYSNGYNFYLSNTNSSHGWDIRNNNFYSAQSNGLLFYATNLSSKDLLSGNNYYLSGKNLAKVNGLAYSGFADFNSAMAILGLGWLDQNINTTFKNAPTDLHYASLSSLPFGRFAGITTDADGDARCKVFATAGADEGKPTFAKPTSSFSIPTSIFDGSPVIFKNASYSSDPQLYRWYVNGVYVSDSIDLLTTALRYPSAIVTLVTINCSGKDSVNKSVSISLPTKAPTTDFVADANDVLQDEIVKFHDLSLNHPSSWQWSISPAYISGQKTYDYVYGDSLSANISLRFRIPGKYKICLSVSNVKGKGNIECKTDYINVTGVWKLKPKTKINESKGYIYDDGGKEGDYSSYTNSDVVIAPSCAKTIYLIFRKFDVSCGYGFVSVYDGASNAGKNISNCTSGMTGGKSTNCYYGLPCIPSPTDTFISTSGSMYISFYQGYNSNSDGIEAYFWSDDNKVNSPTASFTVPDSICVFSPIVFNNTSAGSGNSYQWDFNGSVSSIEDFSTSPEWMFSTKGDYIVTLIASNCGGKDTFRKKMHVYIPPVPKANFHADNQNPTTNDIVYFYADVAQCVDNYSWKINSKNGYGKAVFVNNTNSNSPIPQVAFSDTGCYNVMLSVSNVSGKDSILKSCFVSVKNPYCIPNFSFTIPDLGISNVAIYTIGRNVVTLLDHASKQTGAYENYTPTENASLEIGVSYLFKVERTTTSNSAIRFVYIDWNADGDFLDAGELVATETAGKNQVWNDTLIVPAYAHPGATVMRVAIIQSSQSGSPCSNSYGEYEDYRLYLSYDHTPPALTLVGPDTIWIEQGYPFKDPGATALDNLSGNITKNIKVTYWDILNQKNRFDVLIPSMYLFTYAVSDDAGNAAAEVQRIVIVTPDKTAPYLEVHSDSVIIVGVHEPFKYPEATATDLVDGNLDAEIQHSNNVNPDVLDTYKVVYSVKDNSQNLTLIPITIIVADTTAPKLMLRGQKIIFVEAGTKYVDSGVAYSDNYYKDSILNLGLIKTGAVDTRTLGTYQLGFYLTDPSGNSAIPVFRQVIVRDTTPPSVSLVGAKILNVQVKYRFRDPGLIILDNLDTKFDIDTSGTFYDSFPNGIPTKLGLYNIAYSVADGSGNTSIIRRSISVVDTIRPVIRLNGPPLIEVCQWDNYLDSGYSLSDNYYPNNQIKVTTEGDYQNTDIPGIRILRYRAEDSSHNVSYSEWRFINITAQNVGNCITGIRNSNSPKIRIYPNPLQDELLTVSSPNPMQIISVYDVTGKLIHRQDAAFSTLVRLDLGTLNSGMYMITVSTQAGIVHSQLVISH